jgi:hypothetical protein
MNIASAPVPSRCLEVALSIRRGAKPRLLQMLRSTVWMWAVVDPSATESSAIDSPVIACAPR